MPMVNNIPVQTEINPITRKRHSRIIVIGVTLVAVAATKMMKNVFPIAAKPDTSGNSFGIPKNQIAIRYAMMEAANAGIFAFVISETTSPNATKARQMANATTTSKKITS